MQPQGKVLGHGQNLHGYDPVPTSKARFTLVLKDVVDISAALHNIRT